MFQLLNIGDQIPFVKIVVVEVVEDNLAAMVTWASSRVLGVVGL